MESNWTRADFKTHGKPQAASSDILRSAHELLGRELGLSLSAFLRCSVTAGYQGAEELPFSDLQQDEGQTCVGLALVRPDDRKLLVALQHSALFPLIGVALGAKSDGFSTPERKPTEIELQVVNILFRLVLAEAYRAWAPLVKTHLETSALEIGQLASRPFPPADPVLAARYELTIGEHAGVLSFVVPADLFARTIPGERQTEKSEMSGSIEENVLLMLPAKVALDVWLDGSQMRLRDLLQLSEGQIVTLDHPVERKAVCTLNGKPGFGGQIVSTGTHRAFLVEDTSRSHS